jgi:hypothetical protein
LSISKSVYCQWGSNSERCLEREGNLTAVVVALLVVVFNVVAVVVEVVGAAPVTKQLHALDAFAVLVVQNEETNAGRPVVAVLLAVV